MTYSKEGEYLSIREVTRDPGTFDTIPRDTDSDHVCCAYDRDRVRICRVLVLRKGERSKGVSDVIRNLRVLSFRRDS